ncbi:MAG TPA: ATP-dependent helicase C-terminal domain-containing protein, partial [Candidatus Sulfotelmatobacter sp.]|nr:ATP-dependent helicase C-terminal domain-containing protein [Candidatus Sulfotelmatobacter sp.]
AAGGQSWLRAVRMEQDRILRRMGGHGTEWDADQESQVGGLLASAFADRIARKEPDRTYRLLTGRMARFPGAGAGAHVPVPSRAATAWIVAPDADAGETVGIIRLAAPMSEAEVERIIERVANETREIRWEGLVPKGFLVRRAGRLVLTERPVRPEPAEVSASFQAHLMKQGIAILPWNASSRELLARMRALARYRPDRGLGDLSDEGLAARAAEWLGPFLKLGGGQPLGSAGLQAALAGLLGGARGDLDREAPQFLTLPTGKRRAIDYTGPEPTVEARIQEVFGLARSPLICGTPLTFRLLSPASRPLQITRDLASFWATTYAEVRREMRGRYPKHYWPDDPLQAEPTAGVRPRK